MGQSFSQSASFRWIGPAVLIAASLGAHGRAAEDAAAEQLVTIEVQLVDGDGEPVEGAEVGISGCVGSFIRDEAAETGTEWRYLNHARSGLDGVARCLVEPARLDWLSLIARHESRKIAALTNVDRQQQGEPVQMKLLPEREVVGETVCPSLPLDRSNQGAVVNVYVGEKLSLECHFDEPKFRIPLPPGKFTLRVRTVATYGTKHPIVVASEKGEQRIEPIELRPLEWALLVGNPAPEIPDVLAWKNSEPVKLADLRGKVVLLEFWGYWCGPCVGRMPELFDLYDKYHDSGLDVIGVHVDLGEDKEQAVDTVAKLDVRLIETRRDLWNGRDLPFPVALVLGKRVPSAESLKVERSAASARFGIISYPTQILIDRQGNVVGKFYPNEAGIALLEKTLAEK